jgi:PPK2 family polyphosphate:nucleotide phosphotransferase
VRDWLRVRPGITNPSDYPPGATPGAPGRKDATLAALGDGTAELADLQERFFAESTTGSRRRILLVLQGMDTSGKGGVIDHVVGQLGPAGTSITSFKRPSPQEQAHHYLWRIRRALPTPGHIGVFDRSHYEDVLAVRVHDAIDDAEVGRRFEEINAFEAGLTADGVTIIKCFLNVSYEQQRARLLARLDDPTKHWKFSAGDLAERGLWHQYMTAYGNVLAKTSTAVAPWFVIPADHKWYRNWAISEILRETLIALDPKYPQPELDVTTFIARLQPAY